MFSIIVKSCFLTCSRRHGRFNQQSKSGEHCARRCDWWRSVSYSRYTNFWNWSMAHFADAHWTDSKCATPIGQILNLSNRRRRNVPCFSFRNSYIGYNMLYHFKFSYTPYIFVDSNSDWLNEWLTQVVAYRFVVLRWGRPVFLLSNIPTIGLDFLKIRWKVREYFPGGGGSAVCPDIWMRNISCWFIDFD